MHALDMTADELVSALLTLSLAEPVCILDSCGARHLGSHLLIAGIRPIETIEIRSDDVRETLQILDEKLSSEYASIFTISYDFGLKLLDIEAPTSDQNEPDVFLSQFDVLIIHDYDAGTSFLIGNNSKFGMIAEVLTTNTRNFKSEISNLKSEVTSNFARSEYIATVEKIKERIRCGDTYQTNLTQQLTATLPADLLPELIFYRLRRDHPAPFATFIKRTDSTVISASPERFFSVGNSGGSRRRITTSPIKGTRPRGATAEEDNRLKQDLLSSPKDKAENIMIVDLLRNDLGRVCEYGSVEVEKLCELEEHPSLFHLVSTVAGELRPDTSISDILKAVFPCGSITGAPKISTMKIIDELEPSPRGLSMGAIGVYVPSSPTSNVQRPTTNSALGHWALDIGLSLSVAIRTIVIRDQTAIFNVGGGIVIDSDPESEYEETLTKAKAILSAIGATPPEVAPPGTQAQRPGTQAPSPATPVPPA